MVPIYPTVAAHDTAVSIIIPINNQCRQQQAIQYIRSGATQIKLQKLWKKERRNREISL